MIYWSQVNGKASELYSWARRSSRMSYVCYKKSDQCGDAHSELQLGELVPKPDISKGNGLHQQQSQVSTFGSFVLAIGMDTLLIILVYFSELGGIFFRQQFFCSTINSQYVHIYVCFIISVGYQIKICNFFLFIPFLVIGHFWRRSYESTKILHKVTRIPKTKRR